MAENNYIENHLLISDFAPMLGSQELQSYLDSPVENTFSLETYEVKPDIFNDTSYLNKPPINTELEIAPYNFEVNLPPPSGKNNWAYSAPLRKAFIKMNKSFIVKVSYNNCQNPIPNTIPDPLYLRIMPIFTANEDQHLPVKRCLNHQSETDDNNLKAHIVTCKQPINAIYEGNPESFNYGDRLSLKIPLNDQNGQIEHTIGLEFTCQNSCTSGMNRKCTTLLFVLETTDRTILGRRLLPFKVCSCPKRDMDKEEAQLEIDNKNKGEKRKREQGDTTGSRKKVMIKRENVSPPPAVTVNGHTVKLVLPNLDCLRQVQEAASNAIAAYLVDSDPVDRKDWENYRKTL